MFVFSLQLLKAIDPLISNSVTGLLWKGEYIYRSIYIYIFSIERENKLDSFIADRAHTLLSLVFCINFYNVFENVMGQMCVGERGAIFRQIKRMQSQICLTSDLQCTTTRL